MMKPLLYFPSHIATLSCETSATFDTLDYSGYENLCQNSFMLYRYFVIRSYRLIYLPAVCELHVCCEFFIFQRNNVSVQ